MERIIILDNCEPVETTEHLENEYEEQIDISENADAYEEVIRRQDDIDQLTSDYLCALIGIDGETIDLTDIGIDTGSLNAIEDAIEELLSEFGIIIYRPAIIEDENGKEIIVNSLLDINQ